MQTALVIHPVTTPDGRTLTGGFDPETGVELIRGSLSEVVRFGNSLAEAPTCHNCGAPAVLGCCYIHHYCAVCWDGLKDKYRGA